MKVIVTGLPKTGTKSMNAALGILGYTVYDFLEHAYYHYKEWKEIMKTDGSPRPFADMYKNVDAVVDLPVNYFWEQIHQNYPDSKIIHMTRDEDDWHRSLLGQLRANSRWSLFKLATILTPTGRMHRHHINKCMMVVFGMSGFTDPNETVLRLKFRQHNSYVLHQAPADKLLVMNISDGWEPLCKFLDVEVPDEPFPHKNKGATAVKEAAVNPVMQKILRELNLVFVVLILLLALLLFKIWGTMA